MTELPPITRTAYFWRPVQTIIYRHPWTPIQSADQPERLLVGTIPIRDAEGDKITVNGKDTPFQIVGVHAWIDGVADGICLEITTEPDALPRCMFITRASLAERYPGKISVANPIQGVLEPTARAIWLNAARDFVPPSATIFWRRVPLEELYGYQIRVWGGGSRSYPLMSDIKRQAFDPSTLHVKIFGSFLAL